MVVPDAQRDQRFADSPLVTSSPNLRFYPGAPLVTVGGQALGTLCVLDREPGEMNLDEIDDLRTLARRTMAQLERRRGDTSLLRAELDSAQHQVKTLEAKLQRREDVQDALQTEAAFREAVIERVAHGVCVHHTIATHPFVQFTVWSQRMVEITGYTKDEINRLGWFQTVYPDALVQQTALERIERARKGEDLRGERREIVDADKRVRAVRISTPRLTSSDGLEHVLALMHDLTEREDLHREAMLGRQDVLTGMKHLRGFKEETEILLRLALRTGAPSARGFLDLDDLKQVNDSPGHAESDRVLERGGSTLLKSTRSTDVVGRIGGDEFAMLLPSTGLASARTIFDRLHRRFAGVMGGHRWPVGLSVGVAVFGPNPPGMSDALGYADSLMYQAKRSGKNRVVYGEYPGH